MTPLTPDELKHLAASWPKLMQWVDDVLAGWPDDEFGRALLETHRTAVPRLLAEAEATNARLLGEEVLRIRAQARREGMEAAATHVAKSCGGVYGWLAANLRRKAQEPSHD